MNSAGVEHQIALIQVLVDRQDVAARPMIIEATSAESRLTRIAAIRALKTLGDATSVPLLAKIGARNDPEQAQAARKTLEALEGRAVDQAIVWEMNKAEPPVKVELIRSLAARKTAWAAPELLAAANDKDQAVRAEAFTALGAVAEPQYLQTLVKRMLKTKAVQVRSAAEGAVVACGKRTPSADRAVGLVLRPMPASKTTADRCSLLRAAGKIGGRKALTAVRAALKDEHSDVREVAARCLADWPGPEVSDDLLQLAKTAPDIEEYSVALRGYLGQARIRAKDDPAAAAAMYEQAVGLARRDEDKRLVLEEMARVANLQTFELAAGYLKDKALAKPAAASAVAIGQAIARRHRHEVERAMDDVLTSSADGKTKTGARGILADLAHGKDHILAWKVCGPFTVEGKGPTDLFDIPFAPETGAEEATWQPIVGGTSPFRRWGVDLSNVAPDNNCAAYLITRIYSPAEQPARLETGSDDGLKIWLNGKCVTRANRRRRIMPGQDITTVQLRKGWNVLLMKVTQGDGEFAACARLRKPDGGKLNGLRESAD